MRCGTHNDFVENSCLHGNLLRV